MCKLTIRAAQPKDLLRLIEVELAGFVTPWGIETLQQEVGNQDRTHYVVAEYENQIVGYAGLWVIFDEGHITRIAVDPKFRRHGIGRDLAKALMEAGGLSGCMSFTLEVRASNTEALNLYKSLGFEEVGVRPGYYEMEGEDAVIMWYHPPEYVREGASK
jgi:ribosomal-protein-alanine N-acetyltransferase